MPYLFLIVWFHFWIEVSRPSWTYSPCIFSDKRVKLFWNAPSRGAECCKTYHIVPISPIILSPISPNKSMLEGYTLTKKENFLVKLLYPETSDGQTHKSVHLIRSRNFSVQCKNERTILNSSFPIDVRRSKHNQ